MSRLVISLISMSIITILGSSAALAQRTSVKPGKGAPMRVPAAKTRTKAVESKLGRGVSGTSPVMRTNGGLAPRGRIAPTPQLEGFKMTAGGERSPLDQIKTDINAVYANAAARLKGASPQEAADFKEFIGLMLQTGNNAVTPTDILNAESALYGILALTNAIDKIVKENDGEISFGRALNRAIAIAKTRDGKGLNRERIEEQCRTTSIGKYLG